MIDGNEFDRHLQTEFDRIASERDFDRQQKELDQQLMLEIRSLLLKSRAGLHHGIRVEVEGNRHRVFQGSRPLFWYEPKDSKITVGSEGGVGELRELDKEGTLKQIALYVSVNWKPR